MRAAHALKTTGMISSVLDLPRYAFFPEFFHPESREKARLKPQPLTAVLCAPQVEFAELAERAELILADTTIELRDERRHLDAHGRRRAPRHLHHQRGDPRAPVGRLLRQEAGDRAAACREPPRASRTRPDAAALDSYSQDVLSRTVPCPLSSFSNVCESLSWV